MGIEAPLWADTYDTVDEWTSVAISSFHSLLTKSSASRRQNNGVCRDVKNAYIDSGSVLLFWILTKWVPLFVTSWDKVQNP